MSATRFLASFLDLYSYAILAYVVMSWFAAGAGGMVRDVYRGLASICEPFLGLFRRVLPTIAIGGAGLDLSPIIAFFVLRVAAGFILRL